MYAGKTLQVIGLVHTLLANQELTKVTRVMIFTPFNALLNWRSEFDKWLTYCDYRPVVRDISEVKTISARLDVLRNWFETGGVFLIGYQMFLALLAPIRKRKEHIQDELDKYLLNPGPDLAVCDEGHVLKNDNTKISTQINRLRTPKRIVLTGKPISS
jgi:transcriptional regulator ATRX